MDMEIIRFFKKLTLANCLNGVAMRMFRVCYNICYRMVIVAVHLDPNRSSFQNNLSALADVGDKSIKYKQKPYFCYNIPQNYQTLSIQIKWFNFDRTLKLSAPKVINEEVGLLTEFIGEAKLPQVYLSEFNDALVFSSTDLIVVDNICLYDEVDNDEDYLYDIGKSLIAKSIKRKKIIM